MVRWFGDSDRRPLSEHVAFLRLARDRFKTIIFYDDGDPAESKLLYVLPWVDAFWKKQLQKDLSLYLRPIYGNRVFAEYYHERFGVQDSSESYPVVAEAKDLSKLRVAWNLGIGSYPLWNVDQKLAKIVHAVAPRASSLFFRRPRRQQGLEPKKAVCHARFASGGYRPIVAYQRELFASLLKGVPGVLQGLVPKSQYEAEMRTSSAVLSPFGWGEICYRDFEAILNGAVLVKPRMDSLETWPDIFIENQTYIPVAWDGSDLLGKIDQALSLSEQARREMVDTAWEVWQKAYETVQQRLNQMLAEFE
jgi:hypothetical protein